ncbi:MAG: RdgB/HAM1 family non-canonical purine NTP pyrophosphatase [Phycisphaerae bacterium]|nr:RdgB/HAM1 family non-canonical purine NTP pyrophosphatase [Phycisphaerae bacterium]
MQARAIVLATGNPGKVREITAALGDLAVEILSLERFADIAPPAETGQTFAANARDKALYYAAATGQWCLAEDSGLVVDALDGAPGVHSARYAADRCPPGADRATVDQANNAKLLEALAGVPTGLRTARFLCHLALAGEGRVLIETFDTVEGLIAEAPRGRGGFGYDPVFVIPSLGRTTAELSPQQKNALSHRGKAVRHLARLLASFLSQRS